MEGDANYYEYSPEELISIHALRVEGDIGAIIMDMPALQFLSTPSGWRATLRQHQFHSACTHFYPRPPGGGRPPIENSLGTIYVISIHALRVEGDDLSIYLWYNLDNFYPRPPGGGRHAGIDYGVREYPISIHALRVEGNTRLYNRNAPLRYFYPRPPGGGRLL